jgi:threonylcarbamoyladenosine tRNA methylthiotransferase MtaB
MPSALLPLLPLRIGFLGNVRMKIHLKTLGCRLNEAELETWAHDFQKAGHGISRSAGEADVVVVNSCAVTHDAERKSKQLIRRIHRDNPQAKLVVSGCYATLNPEQAAAQLGVDLVVSNQDKSQLVDKALSLLNLDTMPSMATEPAAVALFNRGRQRAFVKVQDGCRYRCTFCIVTVARGEERSRSLEAIVAEINTLHQQGIQEVVITGVHLGGYGSDNGSNLVQLIETILAQTSLPRLRLGSLEPWELGEGFFELFANPRLMPHLHLPLQSGCDSVLKRMARRCNTATFAALVQQARQTIPGFNVTTDIIVGFPGESDAEWQTSVDYIQQLGFGHIHIFSYSPREGTRAAVLPDPVNDSVKRARSKQLHHIAEQLKQTFMQQQLGQQASVLWEGQPESLDNGQTRFFGYTPNYLRVACDVEAGESLENQLLTVRLQALEAGYITAERN